MDHFSWLTLAGIFEFDHIIGILLVLGFLTLSGLKIKSSLSKSGSVLPTDKLTLTNIFEVLTIDFLLDLFTGIFGSRERAKQFFPILGTSFILILVMNLMGLIPGFFPPSGNVNTTWAFAVVIFVMYNYYGFREHGFSYLKQFLGPVIWLAPLMIIIEVVTHIVRPVSLSLRLFWNMNGEHLVLGIFTDLTSYIVPVLFIALGIFVSLLQAFVFTILSSIYISLAISHNHGATL
ncbi:MAG: F0F1 ATP synthase subunit A [Candidatus Dadabacteria bacterium]|nr:F0F1 ATP synthase subunit A [Candidatus Dadabacteria bacterium]